MSVTAIVDLKITGYNKDVYPVNTPGTKFYRHQIGILALYRHAIANISDKLFSQQNLGIYGWDALYRYGIEKSLRRVDDIFALSGIHHPAFLSNSDHTSFSSDVLNDVFGQSGSKEAFLSEVCREHPGCSDPIHNYLNRLIRNPLGVENICDSTREDSYHVGMIFARLYAEQIFGIPFLSHVQDLIDRGAAELQSGMAPDLAGQDLDYRWHAVEAKGTTDSSYLYTALSKAKKQLGSLKLINKSSEITRSACGTLYTVEKVRSLLRDPEPSGDGILTLDWIQSVLSHYKLIPEGEELASLLRNGPRREYIKLSDFAFSGGRVEMSVHHSILSLIGEIRELDREYVRRENPYKMLRQNTGQLRGRILERNESCQELQRRFREITREISTAARKINDDARSQSTGADGILLKIRHDDLLRYTG